MTEEKDSAPGETPPWRDIISRADPIYRSLILANAGGIVAVLSIIGTAIGKMSIPLVAVVPVALFFLGLLAAIMGSAAGYARAITLYGSQLTPAAPTTMRPWWERKLGESGVGRIATVASLGLFAFGGIVGLVFLGWLLTNLPEPSKSNSIEQAPAPSVGQSPNPLEPN